MLDPLSADAVRVLGVLVEKAMSTPEYYPLTLNSLRTGCNQKSNRDPVVSFSESDVVAALDELEHQRLVGHASGAGSRAAKFRHAIAEAWTLSSSQCAVLTSLMLRGPQTVGEIKVRTTRLFQFGSLSEVQEVLHSLSERESPMVLQLPRQPGRKEARYVHLLSGEVDISEGDTHELHGPELAGSVAKGPEGVTEEIAQLRQEMATLREEFERFRDQFG